MYVFEWLLTRLFSLRLAYYYSQRMKIWCHYTIVETVRDMVPLCHLRQGMRQSDYFRLCW